MHKEINWELMCPEGFRDRVMRLLKYPPGSEGSEKVYGTLFPEEIITLNFDEETSEEEKSKRFEILKKYSEAWGEYGEALAIKEIVEKGHTIRDWNWKPPKGKGEIDIISQKGNRIIFIEVKARCGFINDPWKAIDDKKIRNLCRGADIYLKMQKEDYEYQFDVVLLRGNYLNYELEYIEDAFVCPLRTFR